MMASKTRLEYQREEVEFLILIRDKVDLLIGHISINAPLFEISVMLTDRIEQLIKEQAQ